MRFRQLLEATDIQVSEYEGRTGDRSHLTRSEVGNVPLVWVRDLKGKMGEKRGEHRNKLGKAWDAFKADIAKNGIKNPILVIADYNEDPLVWEGNHRIDAAVELGMETIPAEIRYFGNAQQQGTIEQRYQRSQKRSPGPKPRVRKG